MLSFSTKLQFCVSAVLLLLLVLQHPTLAWPLLVAMTPILLTLPLCLLLRPAAEPLLWRVPPRQKARRPRRGTAAAAQAG